MGVVWKARQMKLKRLVALKMVRGEQLAPVYKLWDENIENSRVFRCF
jgi:hypothetical protein